MAGIPKKNVGKITTYKCMKCNKRVKHIVLWQMSTKPKMCDDCKDQYIRDYNRNRMARIAKEAREAKACR